MKIKYVYFIIAIILIINIFLETYSRAINSIDWFERLSYDSEEIQNLIKQKNEIQSQKNVETQKNGFDLIIFMGQSNMYGKGGDSTKAVKPIDGAGYEMRFDSNNNAQGLRKMAEPFGDTTGGSMVTAFTNAYYNNTGTPVIAIAAAVSGTSVYDYWQEGQKGLVTAKERFESAEEWLKKKGYPIKHRYMIWNQGEADVDKIEYTDENNVKHTYGDALRNTVESMQDSGVDRCFMIRIGAIYIYKGYEDKYKERYKQYVEMVKKQTEISSENWITLVSTSMETLSRCENMMSDVVHFNQEALDIVGSEAGKNVAFYADKSRERTLTSEQENALINFSKNFSYWGTKNNAILYGTLVKYWSYNFRPVPYKDQKNSAGEYTRQIIFDSSKRNLIWKNLENNTDYQIGSYGYNGETEFPQGYYIGFDCSGFTSFLYHQVLGVPFDYEYQNIKDTPWTIEQYLENRKLKSASGEEEIDAFKFVYQKIYKKPTISFSDILDNVNFQKGDLIIGIGEKNLNHIGVYAGKDEKGEHKMIHSTSSPDKIYNMYDESLKKYYPIGESYFLSGHKYKEVYVLRLNKGIVPEGYVTNEAYKTESDTSYIDWNKIKKGEKLDSVAPKGNVEFVKQKEQTMVIVTTSEDVMQIEGWKLSKDKRTLTKVYTKNTDVSLNLEDLEGNTSKLNFKVEIDNIAPIAQVTYSPSTQTNKNVIVTIKANEEIQDVEGWILSEDKTTLTKTYMENTNSEGENIIIKDLVGNSTIVNVKVTNIDNIAPITQVSYSPSTQTDKNVIVTIKANEEIQDAEGWTLSEDKTTLTKTYTENTNSEGENIIIKDLVGNSTIVNVKVTNIERYFKVLNYIIKDNYIKKVRPNTRYSEFVKNIQSNMKYIVKEGEKVLQNTDIMKTGQELIVDKKVYTIVVIGDLNGDGKINISELAKISKIGVGKITNISEIEKVVIDANSDGEIKINDLAAIAKEATNK